MIWTACFECLRIEDENPMEHRPPRPMLALAYEAASPVAALTEAPKQLRQFVITEHIWRLVSLSSAE